MTSPLGKYIEDELKKRNWTRKTLSQRSKISHVTLSQVLTGQSQKSGLPFKITLDTLESIANGLQVPMLNLFYAYLGLEQQEDVPKQEFGFETMFQQVLAEQGKKLSMFSSEDKAKIRESVLQLNQKLLKASIEFEIEKFKRPKKVK